MWLAVLPGSENQIEPWPGGSAVCPTCGAAVDAKCGEIVAWHWAHRTRKDCDHWAEGETDWHVAWKRRMPRAEVVFERGGKKHRADAVTVGGMVVEFQHSPISPAEIAQREAFYGRMVWVFDAREAHEAKRLTIHKSKWGHFMRWKHSPAFLRLCGAPVYLDLGDKLMRVKQEFWTGRWDVTLGTSESFEAWARAANPA